MKKAGLQKRKLKTLQLIRKRRIEAVVLLLLLLTSIGCVLAHLVPTHFMHRNMAAFASPAVALPKPASPAPVQTNTSLRLSKGYIYAGNRLVATEEPMTALVPPSGLAMEPCSGASISWFDNSDNETGFKVERSVDGQTYTLFNTVAANATTSTILWAKTNPSYYRVRAINSAVESAPSGAIYASAPGCRYPNSLPSNSSLSVNGTSAYVNVLNSQSLNITGPITVEAWVKTNIDGTFFNRVISRYSETNGGYVLDLYHNKVRFWLIQNATSADYVDGNTKLNPNVWYHIAGVADGQQMRVYVNGFMDGWKPSQWLPYSSPEPLQIGGGVYGGQFFSLFAFNGMIDEVRISSSALYNGTFTPQIHLSNLSTTRALWTFDDQTARDSSGNGNNGTFTGGAVVSSDVPPVREPVEWASATAVNVTITGNNLRKNAGTNAAWDGGAASTKIFSGDGYLEFIASENTTDRLVGLSASGTVPSYYAIDYGIRQYYGSLYIIESNSTNLGNVGPYVAGDSLRVAVENGVVHYYRNNTLLYTSARTPNSTMRVAACLYDPGASVSDAGLTFKAEP